MTTETAGIAATDSSESSEHLVIDLGKQKRKKVKALRRGQGSLTADVDECLEELRKEGKITSDAQVVIVVVEKKRKRSSFPMMMMS